HRHHLDHVLALSPFEAEIERWLGARKVNWLPRVIPDDPVKWRPRGTYVGYVGTLDHEPNAEGLELYLRALERIRPASMRVRIVGSPMKAAEAFTKRYPFIDYLGPLADDQLRTEVAEWNSFVHPLF